tara:strand:+ start:2196 stop:3299 length:1104 start_codon:yes stop_codon:yes gene_type:complete
MNLKIILIILLILSVINVSENFTNYRTSCKSNYLPKLLKKVLIERGMKLNLTDWEYYLPCGYNSCEKQVRKLVGSKNKKIFMIDGCDTIASKNAIFKTLKKKYGNRASMIMPETFNLRIYSDVKRFVEHFKNKKKLINKPKFILKNHRQRQLGLKMINSIKTVEYEMKKKKYYLIQDYLNNPFLINKRKINLRYYLAIICRKGKVEGYIYRDGFVYYTPEFFDYNSIDPKKNITTGYIDRQVYVENPLTTQDFRNYLGSRKSKYFDKIVKKKFYLMVNALKDNICRIKKYPDSTLFQLFGADIAPSDKLDAHFMEINKGPDIGGKDERDSKLKYNMLKGIFELVDAKNCNRNTLNKICIKTNFERVF